MKFDSRSVRSIGTVAAAVVVTLAGLVVNSPAAMAGPSVTNCDPLVRKTKSISGAYVQIDLKRDCKVVSNGRTYYRQDYFYVKAKDTSCDGYGPHVFIDHMWEMKHTKGCNKYQSAYGWTSHISGRAWDYMIRTDSSKGVKSNTGWLRLV